ncbi:MAG: hypothetical protein RL412_1241 [Pseudomonadota bacterium]
MRLLRITAYFLGLGLGLSPTFAHAHDYRPLLVKVSEESEGRYVVSWQPSPTLTVADQPLVELTGAGCKKDLGERSGRGIHNASYLCSDPRSQLSIELTYPNDNPSLPTLLTVSRANGTVVRMTGSPGSHSISISAPQPEALRARSYALIGFDHILRGFDHLIFLTLLWLITGTGWTLIRALTGFTLGHSITLALSTTGVATPSAPFVESMIALSIVLVAAESLSSRRETLTLRRPVAVSTLFGLLHGFGFAGYLREVGLPKDEEISALLMFNIGVEVGQITFISLAVLTGMVITRAVMMLPGGDPRLAIAAHEGKLRTAMSYAGGIIAAYWFFERIWAGLSPITLGG